MKNSLVSVLSAALIVMACDKEIKSKNSASPKGKHVASKSAVHR
jgi:hypothetical protein